MSYSAVRYHKGMPRIEKQLMKEVVTFGAVGVLTLLVDITVTTSLFNIAHFPAYLASGIGFLSGFFVNFPLNRGKVFKHNKDDRLALRFQIIAYAGLSVFNLAATSLLTELLVSKGNLKIAYAKLILTAVIAVWNFIIFKFLIFSKVKAAFSGKLDERVLNDIL
jgi:putative flippase GtrA